MKRNQNTNGLTLVEILVAIAIVALLAAGLYSVGNYIETQSKITLTESTIEMLVTSLTEYRDFYGKFPFIATVSYDMDNLEGNDPNGLDGTISVKNGVVADYNDVYASSEAMYYFLNKCPGSRKIVGSINVSLITNKGNKNREYFFEFSGDPVVYPLRHIIDPWKTPMRYTYKQDNNFPVITSAGPDRKFGDRGTTDKDPNDSQDNITSR